MTEPEDYQRLRQTVTNLLLRIEENQQIQSRFHDFEFQLLSCKRLQELLEKLLLGATSHFDLAAVSLILYDPDYAISGLLDDVELDGAKHLVQVRHNAEFFSGLYQQQPRVILGPLDVLAASRLFPGAPTVGSAALMPLMRQDRQIGSLHFASHSANRYSPDKGVSFMWHLASMVAICIENCVALEQLQRQGQEDTLTQVRNRRSFEEEFTKELERSARHGERLSCMFVDMDHFKSINDSYGHQVGDQCLRQVAKLISAEMRKTDSLARYGGEEFVALLPHCHLEEAATIAERVRLAVANNPFYEAPDRPIPLTVSIGLSTWQPQDDNHESLHQVREGLLKNADLAMYEAKEKGRNRVVTNQFWLAARATSPDSDTANVCQ
ncbi:DUF484 family protein [Aurantivibrio plasticivorans]